MKKMMRRFKKGAASFYVVAFSTLILVIVATSFAVAVVSEVMRTSNDDLSQSAYDAALAGVEDAKLAYENYRSCVAKGQLYTGKMSNSNDLTCEDIVYLMHPDHVDCDTVARVTGRIGKNDPGREVLITETSGSGANNMKQAYTCAKIYTELPDYRASLSSTNSYKVVKVDLGGSEAAKYIKYARISWHARERKGEILNYNNSLSSGSGWRVAFQSLRFTKAATPPTISVNMIQTAENFTMSDLNSPAVNGTTDRATVYLVPNKENDGDGPIARNNREVRSDSTFIGAYDISSGINEISRLQFASTNNLYKNVPFMVYCPEEGADEFMCSTLLELPEPINGSRNNDTFMFVISLPYEAPDTDFSLELCTGRNSCIPGAESIQVADDRMVNLHGQVTIDSTGRANDLYRRVETRMETTDASFAYVMHALELVQKDNGEKSELIKDMTVTKEYSEPYPNLPEYGNITAGRKRVVIYPKVDGSGYPGGLSDFKFNVYVDGTLTASNVRTYNATVKERSTVTVELKNVEGYKTVYNPISESITDDKVITPEWTVAYYPVNLVTEINGKTFADGYLGFNYNVWEDSKLVGDLVRDYSNEAVRYGTKITVDPINKIAGCTGQKVVTTVRNETTITAKWSGTCLPRLVVKTKIDGRETVRDGFTFSVYLGNSGSPVAGNVTSFDQEIAAGTSAQIVINSVRGYTAKKDNISISSVTSNRTEYAEWNVNHYTVDVNPVIDGEAYGQGKDGFLFDVYLNNSKVASKVKDYYNQNVAHDTTVKVVPYNTGEYKADTIEGKVDAGNLYLSPTWHKGSYTVDVNMVVNGTVYKNGVHGLSFNVYANDVLVANNWSDFNQEFEYGTKIRVKANAKNGFTLASAFADVTKIVKGPTEFTPTWNSNTVSVYMVDVNPIIGGTKYANGEDGFVFDVFIDGNKVKSDVKDFYEGTIGGSRVRVAAKDKLHYTITNEKDTTKTINSNTEFTPTWSANVTTITYNGNGGSGSVASQSVYGGQTIALRGNAYTYAGWVFAGWNTAANGSGTSYAAGATFRAPDVYNNSITLYAQWRRSAAVTIKYYANGGSGSMSSQSSYSGLTVQIKSNGFTRSGYAFLGWNTKSGGGGTSYTPGQSVTLNYSSATTINLYAQWKQNATVTIKYNSNGGSGSMSSHSVISGNPITIKSNSFTRTGYTFAGWNTNSSGTGTNYSAGQVWTPSYTSNTTINLYAKWTFTGTYMQDFTVAQCQSLASSSDYTVFDRRDMKAYTVRYTSGRCWMTSNLYISGTISSAYSNFSSPSTLTLNYDTSSSYTSPNYYSDHYNYCAARAGNSSSCSAWGYDSEDGGDICPSNWELPSMYELGTVRTDAAVFNSNTTSSYYWTSTTLGSPGSGNSLLQCGLYRKDDVFIFPEYITSCYSGGYWWGWFRDNYFSIRCMHK